MYSKNPLSLLASVCALALLLGTSPARAVFVVVPNSLGATEGNIDNTFPFYPSTSSSGMRYQQVYAASQFSSLGGAGIITELQFRLDGSFGFAFSETISSIAISLSTTSRNPDGLSATFGNNVGPDSKVVYSGALTLSGSSTGPGPRPFNIILTLQNSFAYDPASGNLLLDVTNFDTSTLGHSFDAENTLGDSVSRVFAPSSSATSGNVNTLGLVTQFNITPVAAVPAPSSLALVAMAMATFGGYFGWRRRKQLAVA